MTDAALPDAPTAAPAAEAPPLRRVELSLPGIHCAGCIASVERTLGAVPGVAAARVNLTLKRVAVTARGAAGLEDRLIGALDAAGYHARPLDGAALNATRDNRTGRALLSRIGVAGFALMNVMLLSFAVWSGASDSTRDLMHWLSAAIALPALAYAAQPFFSNAIAALRAGRLDMDVPISTAIVLAFGVSLWETTRSGAHAFFDAALMLTFFLLVGRYLAHLTRASARSAAAEIAALEVHTATRLRAGGGTETVPLDAVREGDLLAVSAGNRIPADGVVTDGRSEIDAAMLTGETLPEPVAPGASVRAGMTNLSGPLVVRVEVVGEETLLKQIARLVETAERSRGHYASLAERASGWYSHAVNALALVALLGWGVFGGDWRVALSIAAAVLIITCPCALGLAVPAVLTAAAGRLFRQGVLLKDGDALERLGEIDTVVFDKTGTLTTGRPVLEEPDAIPRGALAAAAALSAVSAHPLARAVTRVAAEAGVATPEVTELTEHPGEGIAGRVGRLPARFGRGEWAGAPDCATARTTAWLCVEGSAPIAFSFRDEVRTDAAATVARLRRSGLDVALLSGDGPAPVGIVADALGIADRTAAASPSTKVAYLEGLRAEGRRVLMVGDGLNDAAALAAAHVSISPASAVDASRSAADMIVLGDSLSAVAGAVELSRIARRRIVENFAFAFAYNVVTVPIAMAGLVTPLIAAVAMSASSIAVGLNALRLGKAR